MWKEVVVAHVGPVPAFPSSKRKPVTIAAFGLILEPGISQTRSRNATHSMAMVCYKCEGTFLPVVKHNISMYGEEQVKFHAFLI
jgi:hypothetical protein